MIGSYGSVGASTPVAVLFHPSAVPIVDVFRSLSSLDDQYDLALLDGPEMALCRYTSPEAAKALVSDALLLAFALTRQRGKPFTHRPRGSRIGSLDEYCLLALVGSLRSPDTPVALEAAAALEIASLDFVGSLAGELVRHMESGLVSFHVPDLAEFRAIVAIGPQPGDWRDAVLRGPGLKTNL